MVLEYTEFGRRENKKEMRSWLKAKFILLIPTFIHYQYQ